ncbi:probable WRKY transcription factor 51 isoform X1 [Vitis riparia]|uniref:probable WRKY transcription factor 51 isoform X1 n=1 Tax=Vitis riparia TaxID=96939 RepID=UPI00155AF47E|nr:probable WRKY transcription factor 51 isoform X1 [Vitis riparia]
MDYYYSSSSSPPNPHPNPSPDPNCASQFEFLYHYLMLEDGSEEDSCSQTTAAASAVTVTGTGHIDQLIHTATPTHDGVRRSKETDDGARVVAFRTKSELDVMDDGFKWRKYGKKMVKSSPNPRNYYRCSSGDCQVKKRIERDIEDSSYVITTYTGIHNHPIPGVGYYNQMPLMVPYDYDWTLQASSQSPFS